MIRRLLMVAGGGGSFAPSAPVVIEGIAVGGGGTWFQSPMAYFRAGKTVLGYLDGDGHVWAAEYDHASSTTTTARLYPADVFEIDDHDNPAFVRLADGTIMAGFTTHVGDPYSNFSTNPDDATAWDGPTNLTSQIGSRTALAGYTYAHLHQLTGETGDPVYYTLRYHDASDVPYVMYSKSLDAGATWSARTRVCQITYHKTVQNGDARIDFILSEHPFYGASSIHHMYMQGGDFFETDGTEIVAAQPFAPTAATLVYNGTTDRSWLFDVAIDPATSQPVMAYVVFEAPFSTGNWHYEIATTNGSTWTTHVISDAGTTIATGAGGSEDYAGGIALDREDPLHRAWLSKNTDGVHNIYEYLSNDDWATSSGTQLTFDTDPAVKNFRPVAVLDHDGTLAVLWWHGQYDTYVDYDTATWGAST